MKVYRYVAAAALMAAPTVGFGATINGDVADVFVAGPVTSAPQDGTGTNPPPSSGNPTGTTLKVGSVGNPSDGRVPIFVFQLPDLGAVANPFASASASIGIGATDGDTEANNVNADLYGLSRKDATPTIDFVDDYYLGALDTTNATLVQDNFWTPTTPDGTNAAPVGVETDASGDAALLAFLNAQYDGGLGANHYVYLRLNVDAALPGDNATGYNAATANHAVVAARPLITYEAIPEPTSLGLIGLAGLALARRRRA